jgi:hypothetical protein
MEGLYKDCSFQADSLTNLAANAFYQVSVHFGQAVSEEKIF